jgi:hypothetical protein
MTNEKVRNEEIRKKTDLVLDAWFDGKKKETLQLSRHELLCSDEITGFEET